jgi:hypothetical protein
MKIQRILFALVLLIVLPAMADMAARAETLSGVTVESLQQQLYRAANEARHPDVLYLTGLMFDRGDGVPQAIRKPSGGACLPQRPVNRAP